ncbi:MAG: LLM class flavin-dependent oxidoreductase, partial [Chloroflexi bacterium]
VALDEDPTAARAAVKPMIAGMIKASYPNADFIEQAGLELEPEVHEKLAQCSFDEMERAAAYLPEDFVDAFAWAGTPAQVAEKVAAVVDMGIDRITFLPHATPGCPTEAIVARFAADVMPRVAALMNG